MKDLPRQLQWYLWVLYAITLGVAVLALRSALLTIPMAGQTPMWSPPYGTLVAALVFVGLAYIGERTTLHVTATISQSLSTTVHVATILLFPAPFPVLITLVSVLLSQALDTQRPLYKRAFNICHPVFTVAVSSSICSLVAGPTTVLHAGHVVDALPVLGLLLSAYYVVDVTTLLVVVALVQGQPVWTVWWQEYRPTVLPELAASIIGILAAVTWQYDPVALTLVILPVAALRIAFRAVAQAEDRATALRRRGEQLEAVLSAGQSLRLQHTRADLLQPVAQAACTLVGAETVTSYLPDEDNSTLFKRILVTPAEAAESGPAALPISVASTGMVYDPEGNTLLLPLEVPGEGIVGLMHLSGVSPEWSRNDQDALAILATQTTIALQNALLHERALAQASADGLTGLLNHRAFQTRLQEETGRAERTERGLAVMMVDLDDFKTVNNTYGHQTGDATLMAVAGALRDSVRSSDIVARYGGDEFAVILPDSTLDDAVAVAERAHAAISTLSILHGGMTIRINTSLGVAVYPQHARDRETLIRAADQAAYAAKHSGKGRVCRPEDAVVMLTADPAEMAAQLEHANLATVEALAAAVDAKDAYTRGHSQRVSAYSGALARALGLPASDVARVQLAALLHDVGKIGVPDAILTKAGRLTAEEFAVIQLHPVTGERMLSQVPFLQAILPAVRHHHERWDGAGYPDGIAGETIPQDAAILMVADSFDAMTSSRTYRPALPMSEACRRIREGAETQFQPRIVAAFEQAVAAGDLVVLASDEDLSRAALPTSSVSEKRGAREGDGLRVLAMLMAD